MINDGIMVGVGSVMVSVLLVVLVTVVLHVIVPVLVVEVCSHGEQRGCLWVRACVRCVRVCECVSVCV